MKNKIDMLILFYQKIRRTRFSIYDQLRMDELSQILPCDIHLTYDRDKMPIADVVVFNLPFLYNELEDDLEKPEHQIWVAWSYESEVNYPWMFSDELKDIFDLWMTYHWIRILCYHIMIILSRRNCLLRLVKRPKMCVCLYLVL